MTTNIEPAFQRRRRHKKRAKKRKKPAVSVIIDPQETLKQQAV